MEPLVFSELIRLARQLAGLTQAEVAAEAKIAQPHLNAIERMQRLASAKMQNRILASIYNLASRKGKEVMVDKSGAKRPALTAQRIEMLDRLARMSDKEAEHLILTDNSSEVELKRDIAYLIWRSELEEKQQRLSEQQ